MRAYHRVGETEELVSGFTSFDWFENDIAGASDEAMGRANKKWSRSKGFYNHHVSNIDPILISSFENL